jgi:hypothetical protein|tara:strand:- start:878 stop:1060 length:183 start_codon:yes stop_codon:yes gene_type:complete
MELKLGIDYFAIAVIRRFCPKKIFNHQIMDEGFKHVLLDHKEIPLIKSSTRRMNFSWIFT